MLKLAGQTPESQLLEHESRPDAHMGDLLRSFKAGEYIHNLPFMAVSTITLAAGRIYAVPLIIARALTLDRIALEITAGTAGKIVRLGIYRDGQNLYPAELLLDAGTLAADSAGVKSAAISRTLNKGSYWLACVSDGAPAVRAVIYSLSPLGISAAGFGSLYVQTHYRKDGVGAGSLPAAFPAGAELRIDYAPVLLCRLNHMG